ncbi:hypothetical protein Tco_0510710 [Tanacetum coccineum]
MPGKRQSSSFTSLVPLCLHGQDGENLDNDGKGEACIFVGILLSQGLQDHWSVLTPVLQCSTTENYFNGNSPVVSKVFRCTACDNPDLTSTNNTTPHFYNKTDVADHLIGIHSTQQTQLKVLTIPDLRTLFKQKPIQKMHNFDDD